MLNPKATLQVFYENTSRHTHKKEKKAKITKNISYFQESIIMKYTNYYGITIFKITKVLIKNQNCVQA